MYIAFKLAVNAIILNPVHSSSLKYLIAENTNNREHREIQLHFESPISLVSFTSLSGALHFNMITFYQALFIVIHAPCVGWPCKPPCLGYWRIK